MGPRKSLRMFFMGGGPANSENRTVARCSPMRNAQRIVGHHKHYKVLFMGGGGTPSDKQSYASQPHLTGEA